MHIAPMIFWYRKVSRYTPPNLPISQPRGGGGRGYRSSSCPLEGFALYGGIAEIVSPIAVQWATKMGSFASACPAYNQNLCLSLFAHN